MNEYALGTVNRTGGEVALTGSGNVYDDPRVAKAAWKWIKLHLETTGQKRDISGIESAFSELAILNAVRPNRPELSASPRQGYTLDEDNVVISDDILKRHSLIFGSSGSGKTYFAHLLINQQLTSGYSLIAIDPKPETLHRIRWQCEQVGLAPDTTCLIDAASPEDIPGFNPLRAGDDPEDIVRLMLEWMKKGDSTNAPRM